MTKILVHSLILYKYTVLIMSNVIKVNFQDPVQIEFDQAINKDAALKTIAFKYFGGNIIDASSYLESNKSNIKNNSSFSKNSITISRGEYYQPELI